MTLALAGDRRHRTATGEAGASRIPGLAAVRATVGFQRGMLVAGALIVLFFIVLAVFAPVIAPYGFNADSAKGGRLPDLQAPSAQHWFGTTVGGEDVLSRVVFGAQTALEVIVLAVLLSIVIGVPLGLLSGYFGGWLDRMLVLVTDALFAFPPLLLAIIISIAIAGGQSTQDGRHPFGGHLDHGRLRAAVLPRRPQRDRGRARGAVRRGGARPRGARRAP